MLQPENDESNNSINIVSIKQEVEDEIEANGAIDKIENPVMSVELKFEEDSIDYENSGEDPENNEIPVTTMDIKSQEDDSDPEWGFDEATTSGTGRSPHEKQIKKKSVEKRMPPVTLKKRKNWDKDAMMQAVEAVRKGEMGLKKAAKQYGVPRATLKDYSRNTDKTIQEVVSVPLGRKAVLPPNVEEELVRYCLKMNSNLDLTARDIKRMAFQLALSNNIPNPFSFKKGAAGRKWLHNFFRRHPQLSETKPVSVARIN